MGGKSDATVLRENVGNKLPLLRKKGGPSDSLPRSRSGEEKETPWACLATELGLQFRSCRRRLKGPFSDEKKRSLCGRKGGNIGQCSKKGRPVSYWPLQHSGKNLAFDGGREELRPKGKKYRRRNSQRGVPLWPGGGEQKKEGLLVCAPHVGKKGEAPAWGQ